MTGEPQVDLVGREHELAAVVRALAAGRCIRVEGDAGIGKTAVCEAALANEALSGARVLACRPTEPEAELAYAALGDLVGAAFDPLRDRLPPPQRRALEVALLLAEPEPGPAPLDVRAIALAVVSLIRALAADGPVVVAVDDAQWLDPPSAQVLEFALRRAPTAVLLASRPAGARVVVEAELVSLRPLSVGALHRLLRARLDIALPRPALLRIHETSGGNPFYALELTRALGRAGATGPGPLLLPDDVGALLRSRVQALPPALRDALTAAAALADATVELVAAAGGAEAEAALHDPAARDVVTVEDGRVRFSHPLVAAAALAAAGQGRVRDVHRRLAAVVEAPDQRARHLALAADGPDDAAASSLDAAALSAAARGAPAAAAELAELAAGLSGDRTGRAERLVTAAAHHVSAGAVDRARLLLRPLLDELPAGRLRARVLLQLAHPHDDVDEAVALCDRALAEAADDPRTLAEASRTRHELDILRGDTAAALAHVRAAVRAAERAGDPALLARCLGDASLVETWTGDVTPGWLERAVELERTEPGVSLYYAPSVVRAIRQKYACELPAGRAGFTDALERTVAAGDDAARIVILLHLADLEVRAGAFREADRIAAEGLVLAEQAGDKHWQSALLSVAARAAAALGRADDARRAAARGIALADESGGRIFRLQNLAALGFLALGEGKVEEAVRILREVVPPLPDGRLREPGTLPAVPDAAEALAATGDAAAAVALADELERAAGRGHGSARTVAARVRALLLAQALELEAATAELERAAETQARLGLPFERARTLLVLGSVLRRAKRKAAARAALEEARTAFAELGARDWACRAADELGRIGGRTRAAGLTPTEAKVAALVAEGRSNKEVAAAMFITVRTVESNLTRVYEKLGIRSRAELASRLR